MACVYGWSLLKLEKGNFIPLEDMKEVKKEFKIKFDYGKIQNV